MRYTIILLIALVVVLLSLSVKTFGGEQDGPYILVYRVRVDNSVLIGASGFSTQNLIIGPSGGGGENRGPISVESFPTLAKALIRLNEREQPVFRDDNGASPRIKKEDLILLVKGKRIDVDVQDSGKKVTVSHNVWKTEDVPVQEWDTKP